MRAVARTVLLAAVLVVGSTAAASAQDADASPADPDTGDRRALLEAAVAADVGGSATLPTADGGTCPEDDVEVAWEEIPGDDIELGGYLTPLIVPGREDGDRATGIATCGGDPYAVAGFDAEWLDDEDTWRLGVHPVDLTPHEHLEDTADHELAAADAAATDPAPTDDDADTDDPALPPSGSSDGSAARLSLESTTAAESSTTMSSAEAMDASLFAGADDQLATGPTYPSWPAGISRTPPPLSGSDPQDECLSTIRPGTRALADLITTTYPALDRWTAMRDCDVGGRSEHKEGRALDWFVDADDPDERRIGDRLTRWMMGTDLWGNAHGPARHLGVMYMIWNRQGWYQFWADAGWRDYTGPSPHTDHVHFSLTWPGARCNTTWWEAANCDGTAAAPDRIIRVAGSHRVSTSIQLSRRTFSRASAVVVANASDFPDALSAGALAAAVDGPLLLTRSDRLPGAVADEIRRLGASRVYVAGGPRAVSSRVVSSLQDVASVTRLAGDTRLHTSAAIARRVAAITGTNRVVIVRSDDFADALSASNISSATGAPILLARSERLTSPISRALASIDPDAAWVLGGRDVVSERVRTGAEGIIDGRVRRVAGADRYETSLRAARVAENRGMGRAPAFLASGADFPDALSAGPAAAASGGQLLLAHPGLVWRNKAMLDELASRNRAIDRVFVAGGTAAVTGRLDPRVLGAVLD